MGGEEREGLRLIVCRYLLVIDGGTVAVELCFFLHGFIAHLLPPGPHMLDIITG